MKKLIFSIFCLFCLFGVSAQNATPPSFPGGPTELNNFIDSHFEYPDVARESGIECNVRVQLTIEKTGEISKISFPDRTGSGFEEKITELINKMPPWKPAMQNDIPQKVDYVLPLHFQLR